LPPIERASTPTESFAALNQRADRKTVAAARWTKSLRAFSSEPRRIAPQLRMHGLAVHFSKTRESRIITFQTIERCATAAPHATSDDDLRWDDL
jgi:hypothetical protein